MRKTGPILHKLLRGEISAESAIQKLKRLVPDKQLLRELFDVWDGVAKGTPELLARQKEERAREELAIAKSGRLLKARKAILAGLTTLFDMAAAGDARAADGLTEAAVQAARLLRFLEKKRPELVEPIARANLQWPVLASDEPGWEQEAVRRVTDLKLGTDMLPYRLHFRKARGADANLPARLWAKAAVRTIEATRCRCLSFGSLLHEFGSAGGMADFSLETGWDYGKHPEWMAEVADLKALSIETLPQWKRVVRKMIRQEAPDFHTRPEWATQRMSASARGRDTTGELQNAILDDIGSALERIAPPKQMPKSDC
jgi:hypothetical protein